MTSGFVYILANPRRRLYVGVTSDLTRRIREHKAHWYPTSFTARDDITRLVYIAEFPAIGDAIAYEKLVKDFSRERKYALVSARNPRWNDLAWNWYEDIEEAKMELAEDVRTVPAQDR